MLPQVPQEPPEQVPLAPPQALPGATQRMPPSQQPPALQALFSQQGCPGAPQASQLPLPGLQASPEATQKSAALPPPPQQACPSPPQEPQVELAVVPTTCGSQVVPPQPEHWPVARQVSPAAQKVPGAMHWLLPTLQQPLLHTLIAQHA